MEQFIKLILPVVLCIFFSSSLHASLSIKITFQKDSKWNDIIGQDCLTIIYDDKENSFRISDSDTEIALSSPNAQIPPLVLFGAHQNKATIHFLVNDKGNLVVKRFYSWDTTSLIESDLIGLFYNSPIGKAGTFFKRRHSARETAKVLFPAFKKLNSLEGHSITRHLVDALTEAQTYTAPDSTASYVSWADFPAFQPIFTINVTPSSTTPSKKFETQMVLAPAIKPLLPEHQNHQPLDLHPDELLENIMQLSLFQHEGITGSLGPPVMGSLAPSGGAWGGSMAPAPAQVKNTWEQGSLAPTFSTQDTVETGTACSQIFMPTLASDETHLTQLPPLIKLLNEATIDNQYTAQMVNIGKTSPQLSRIDLTCHQLNRGVAGLLKARAAGAESIVYEGVYYSENRYHEMVAIKQMVKTPGDLIIEARRLRLLEYYADPVDHPHIMKVRDWLDTDRYLLSVETYGAPLDTTKEWEEEELHLLAFQMIQALAALHQREIVHRDFKPANIVWKSIQGKSHYLLTDFGTLRPVSGNQMTMSMAGTLMFMPAERIKSYLSGNYSNETNGYEHDLIGYALSLLTLHIGFNPSLFINSHEPSISAFATELAKIQEASQTGKVNFKLELQTFLNSLKRKQIREIPDNLLHILYKVFSSLDEAGSSTASLITKEIFPDGERSQQKRRKRDRHHGRPSPHDYSSHVSNPRTGEITDIQKTYRSERPDSLIVLECPTCSKQYNIAITGKYEKYNKHITRCSKAKSNCVRAKEEMVAGHPLVPEMTLRRTKH